MGKKKFLKIIKILLSGLLLLGLCACAKEPKAIEVEYQKAVAVFRDVYSNEMYNKSQDFGTQATAGHIKYFFASEFTDDQIKTYVAETNRIIQKMEEFGGISEREYEIYICGEDYVPTVDGDYLYTDYKPFGKVEHIVEIAQLVFGNKLNYGLLYGYSMSLAQEIGYELEIEDFESAIKLYDWNPEYMDLNYACFTTRYVDAPNIEKLKAISYHYFQYLKANDKTDIFMDYSNETHRMYFNAFLTANGKKAYNNSEMDNIYVYAGGNELEFIWEDRNVVYHLEKDFSANYIAWCFYDDMIDTGYKNLRILMLDYEKQTDFVKEKMLPLGCEDRKGYAVFTVSDDHYNRDFGGITYFQVYPSGRDEIYLFDPSSLQHEFVHFFMSYDNPTEWQHECVARYYTYYPENIMQNYDMQSMAFLASRYEAEQWLKIIERHLGHAIDWANREDYLYFVYANVAYEEYFTEGVFVYTEEVPGNFQKQAFAFYLADVYGEEEALTALIYDQPEKLGGKDWDELFADWENYLCTEFSWAIELE